MFGRYERLKTPCDVDKRLMEDDPSVIFAGGTDLMVKGRERNWYEQHTFPVSYTHLTLPTIA